MTDAHATTPNASALTIRYGTRCYFNVRSKADISQLNLPHGLHRKAAYTYTASLLSVPNLALIGNGVGIPVYITPRIKNSTGLYLVSRECEDKLVLSAQKWQMVFNVDKCKVMHVGNWEDRRTYYMEERESYLL